MKQLVYTTIKLGYILGDKNDDQIQERTDKVQNWCKENVGESYIDWMFNYELHEDTLTFMCEEDAIVFKLKFKL